MSEKNLFGKTESEQKAADSLKCREIVQEINQFGVNQPQVLMIIKLLSLQLENRELSSRIIKALSEETTVSAEKKLLI